jgi:hypothetical protein
MEASMQKRIGVLLLMVSILTGCDYFSYGATSLASIQTHAAQMEQKEVKVIGTVKGTSEFPFINMKMYILKDTSGEMLVTTDGLLPKEGEKIALTGRVENAATISGQSLGVHIKEIKRLTILI